MAAEQAADAAGGGRGTRRHHLTLRRRAMAAFGLVSLLLAGTLAAGVYVFVRARIVEDREVAAIRQAYTNARLIRNRLRTSEADLPTLLSGLQTTGTGNVLVERTGRWYSSSVEVDRSVLPTSLRTPVGEGHVAWQIVDTTDGPALMIGVPIAEIPAQMFVVESLDDVDGTLTLLRNALAAGAVLAAVLGAVAGAVISGRVLRPLRDVSLAARRIASGEDDTRLPPTDDPDLAPLTDSFNDMVDELDERARREARFASDVSHDLRGPLTALAAAVAVVNRRRDQLPDEALAAMDALEEQVTSFNSLVVDLLEISRFEAGTVDLELRNVDILELVRAVVHEADLDVLIIPTAGYDPRADVDPRRLQRVLVNLLENAARYAGGATAIRIEPGGPARVAIAVEDRGPGVPPELREAIFNRYERGRAATDPTMAKGTGLGLALAAQHVRLHGGTIRVEDNPGGGSRFVIELPEVTR